MYNAVYAMAKDLGAQLNVNYDMKNLLQKRAQKRNKYVYNKKLYFLYQDKWTLLYEVH